MPIVNAMEMLHKATRDGYAVGAFNVTSIVQMLAAVDEAVARRAPVIIQTSVAPSKFLTPALLVAAFRAAAADAPVPVCLHLDHCTEVEHCKRCADAGYTNIMIDASAGELEENIRQTREVVQYVHAGSAASVEGELGRVGGVEDEVSVDDEAARLCDPDSAVRFVRETGVDIFAPAIGTAHGVYRTADPRVDFDRFARIRERLAREGLDVPLVVHGGTGLPEKTVRRLVALGGAKFNVSTELKHTLIDATRNYIAAHPDEYNPGRLDTALREATRRTVGHWMEILGSPGRA